jgi:DNA invertase Pin-like site-specific DNA recombinase
MTKTLTSAIDVADRAARPGRLRAVAYLRVSTEEQAKGYGIAYTEKKVLRYFEKKRYDHVGTFADEGLSGSLEAHQRPKLKELMELARQQPRPFDLVGVNEGRAIGRTGRAFWRWVWELEDLGVYVAVAKKDYDNSTASGRSQMRKDADYAEEERELIRDRTQGGIQEKAEEGKHPGGIAPYGWRIEDKGVKGESHLVLDVCPSGEHCTERHEMDLLERAWQLIVMDHKNRRQAAMVVNAEGFRRRNGGLWSERSLGRVLTSRAVQKGELIWRNPETAGRKHGTKVGVDGQPLNGQTVVIELPRAFGEAEVARLNKAMERNSRGRRADRSTNVHPLSKRLYGSCGKYYTGLDRCDRPGRMYRCTGKIEAYPGAKVCDCSQVDADAVEERVWAEVCSLLQDPDRLTTMAMDWLEMANGQKGNHDDRIADLDKKIEAQDKAIAAMMVVAAQSGQSPEAIAMATKTLQEEREKLVKLRDEALAWKQESELAQQRAHDLQALAEMARERMRDMTPEEKAEVCDLLDLKVVLAGPVPKKVRADDTLTAWFRSRGRGVPVLDDTTWGRVRHIFEGADKRQRQDRIPHRKVLEAVLLKARTGKTWKELPEEYGKTTGLTTRYQRWLAAGLFEQAMDELAECESTPLPDLYPLPPLLVEGRIDPRLLVRVPTSPQVGVTNVTLNPGVIHFRMELAA